ncbi:MAG: hypothetical protein CSA40_00035 [Flavobacteriales bacterium]|nr:MAG: hypothetical protein CSA40_00035 [Flavobacteriales bacterium]
MIAFDLMNFRSLWERIENSLQSYQSEREELERLLNNIARTAQSKLPHSLMDIGTSSSGPDFQSSYNTKPKSNLVKALVAPTVFMSDSFLAWDLEFTLKTGIYVGAFWESAISQTDATHYAEQFVNHFMTGGGQKWYDDGGLSHVIRNSPEGQRLMQQISKEFRAKMFTHKGDFSKVKLNQSNYSTPSFSWNSSPTLKILVGGTQSMKVSVTGIFYNPKSLSWLALISVEIRDDFGVTESDITDASPSAKLGIGGLTDMWVLQHQRGQKPFTSVFNFSFFCYDNY